MKKRLPGFLAILTVAVPTILAINARAAEIQIADLGTRGIRITGGIGDHAWHIQYGSATGRTFAFPGKSLSLAGPGNTAFFTHENWLRRIDAERGIVTGRWRFPGLRITALSWKDDHLLVQVEDRYLREVFRPVFDFNPAHPQIPYWPVPSFLAGSTGEVEAQCCRGAGFNDKTKANEWLEEAENSVHRDPLSPWFRIELGHIYKALGRPEATALFEQAVHLDSVDYIELLHISTTLDDDNLPQLAREAYERGYEEYWKRGMDPRFNASLLGQFFIYANPRKISETLHPELIDRRYRVGPWVESAPYAWDSYANLLENAGKPQEAALWHNRALEARQNSLYLFNRTLTRWYETAFTLVPAVHLAAVLFVLAMFFRYLPERRLRARARQARFARGLSFFNAEYWSRSDRIAFLTVAVASWLSLGAAGALTEVLVRQSTIPLNMGMGSFGGPVTEWYIQNRLRNGPERDLLLAIAYQNDAQNDKAERLYRQLSQFPESWNNLGVLLQDSGKTAEARQAFEQALRLNPKMADARWNLEHQPRDFWTEMHQRFVADRGMITPPDREHYMTAFGFGSPFQFALQTLSGAFTGYAMAQANTRMVQANTRFVIPRPFNAGFFLTMAECAAALIILLALPYKDVTQPAYKSLTVLEYLVPGIAPQWRFWGGIVLVAWAALALQWAASLAGVGTIAFGGFPNIQRTFGVPVTSQPSNVFQLNAPYMLGGIVLLYGINAVLIWRSRRSL